METRFPLPYKRSKFVLHVGKELKMAVNIALACEKTFESKTSLSGPPNLVCPGDVVVSGPGFMRGHGTYIDDERLIASVAGTIERVNKVISVKPLKTRYNGEIGDVVVGRVTEVQQNRWKVETNSRLDSVLPLSSFNLPGGELRRKTTEDERMMRQYLVEGDLISAEVQQVHSDGSLALHTRSLKYGKLGQGTLVQVSPSLIKRCKNHFHNLPCGAHVIFGNNGFVFIGPTVNEEEESGGFVINLEPISLNDRQTIARLRNCLVALAENRVLLFDTSLVICYEASLTFEVKDLLLPDIASKIAAETRKNMDQN